MQTEGDIHESQNDQYLREYEHAEYSEEILQRITAFEVQKARRQDTGCYTMRDLGRTPL